MRVNYAKRDVTCDVEIPHSWRWITLQCFSECIILEKIFIEAGFEFRQAGCSACLAMNGDTIPKGEYCVSTSNRNFEGRQGAGSRTLLASPVLAGVTAIEGRIVDNKTIAEWIN